MDLVTFHAHYMNNGGMIEYVLRAFDGVHEVDNA